VSPLLFSVGLLKKHVYQKTIFRKESFHSQELDNVILTEYIFCLQNIHLQLCEVYERIKLNKTHKNYSI